MSLLDLLNEEPELREGNRRRCLLAERLAADDASALGTESDLETYKTILLQCCTDEAVAAIENATAGQRAEMARTIRQLALKYTIPTG